MLRLTNYSKNLCVKPFEIWRVEKSMSHFGYILAAFHVRTFYMFDVLIISIVNYYKLYCIENVIKVNFFNLENLIFLYIVTFTYNIYCLHGARAECPRSIFTLNVNNKYDNIILNNCFSFHRLQKYVKLPIHNS